MKEYIFQINNNPAGNDIVVANAPTGLVVKNILAIINKTTGKPVHSPIAEVIDAVTYSGTTMTITLDSNAPSIEGNLLIKVYTDDDGYAKEATLGASQDTSVSTTIFGWLKSIRDFLVGIVTTNPYAKDSTVAKEEQATLNKVAIMGGKAADVEAAVLPVFINDAGTGKYGYACLVGDMDYVPSYLDQDWVELNGSVGIGTVFKVTRDNSEDEEYGIRVAPKTVNEAELSINFESSLSGVTEWIEFEKDKCYIVTGIYHVKCEEYGFDDIEYDIYTYAEYEQGRSVKEVYSVLEALTGGGIEIMTDAEYAAFKSHMETEIANILTPIIEE